MTLRLRLIVAFVLLSVVPLGAMTWYSYSRSERAFREAAEKESSRLTGELTARMSLITTQLSRKVEQVMDMEGETSVPTSQAPQTAKVAVASTTTAAAPKPAVSPARTKAAADAPVATDAASDAAAQDAAAAAFEAAVAARLGEATMLLNNIELSGTSASIDSAATGVAGSRGSRGFPPPGSGNSFPSPGEPTAQPRPDGSRPPDLSAGTTATPADGGRRGGGPNDFSMRPPMWGPPAPNWPGSGGPVTVDLTGRRRLILRGMSVPGTPFDAMAPTERQRVVDEVNQRLLGIQQDLKRNAAERQKEAATAARATSGAKPAQAPAAPKSAAAPSPAPATFKRELTGTHLNVRREQNGIVVGQAQTEVNLRNLLATVFSLIPRDSGEIPFAVGQDGQIYTEAAEDRQKIEGLGSEITAANGKTGTTRLTDWMVVTTADPTGSGLKFGIARPVGEALEDIRAAAARSAGLGLLFIFGTLIGIVPLSGGLTRSLSRLNEGVHQIASGDYKTRVTVERHDEIGQLAHAFNDMAAEVERHQDLAVGQERLKRELELGRQIQHDMLPHAPLRAGGIAIHGISVAAGEVGGDFFNYFELEGGRIALLVGDVSGKGVGAALLMANIQASLRTRLMLGQGLTALAEEIDREIQANTPEPVYATLFIGILDPASRVLRYINAGHNPQYVLRRADGLERLESSGMPVGLLAGHGYVEATTQLAAGDVVFCYTDGCVEMENEQGDMFGAEALEREIVAGRGLDAEQLLRHVNSRLESYRGSREPFDDATMMVVRLD